MQPKTSAFGHPFGSWQSDFARAVNQAMTTQYWEDADRAKWEAGKPPEWDNNERSVWETMYKPPPWWSAEHPMGAGEQNWQEGLVEDPKKALGPRPEQEGITQKSWDLQKAMQGIPTPQVPLNARNAIYHAVKAFKTGDFNYAAQLLYGTGFSDEEVTHIMHNMHEQLNGKFNMETKEFEYPEPYPAWNRFGKTAASQVMYHVAPRSARESIMANGLDSSMAGSDGWNVLTEDPKEAHGFAEFYRSVEPQPHDTWQVDASGLNLEPDPDYTEGGIAGTWRTNNPIPPNRLRLLSEGTTARTAKIPEEGWERDPLPPLMQPNEHGQTMLYHFAHPKWRDSNLANGLHPSAREALWEPEQQHPGVYMTESPQDEELEDPTNPYDLYQVDVSGLPLAYDDFWHAPAWIHPNPIPAERVKLLRKADEGTTAKTAGFDDWINENAEPDDWMYQRRKRKYSVGQLVKVIGGTAYAGYVGQVMRVEYDASSHDQWLYYLSTPTGGEFPFAERELAPANDDTTAKTAADKACERCGNPVRPGSSMLPAFQEQYCETCRAQVAKEKNLPWTQEGVKPDWLYGDKTSMAERSGDSQLDALIEEFKAGEYDRDGEMREVEGLRDPEAAYSFCATLAEDFADFASQRGVQANAPWDEPAMKQFPWGQERRPSTPEDFGLQDRAVPGEDNHATTIVQMPSGTYSVDWTAAQYGYTEFPMVQKLDESGGWQREWVAAFDRPWGYENINPEHGEVPPRVFHVAPSHSRDDILANGLDAKGRTHNLGFGWDKWNAETGVHGDPDEPDSDYEYRPEGIYTFNDYPSAMQYAQPDHDIWEINTQHPSMQGIDVIRDPSIAHNWGWDDYRGHVFEHVPKDAVRRVEPGEHLSSDWMGDAYPGEDHTEEKTIDRDWTALQFEEHPREKVDTHNWVCTGDYVLVSDDDVEDMFARMGHHLDNAPIAYGTVDVYYNYEMMFSIERSNVAPHLIQKALKKYAKDNQLKFEGLLSKDGSMFMEKEAASWVTAEYPGVGRGNPEKLWGLHDYGDDIPVNFYGEQNDPWYGDERPKGEMICHECGYIADSFGDFLVHENREHNDGLGIPKNPHPVVDLDEPMPAHFNTNPDTRTDQTINRQARRMPNFMRYAADIRELAHKTFLNLMARPDVKKLEAEYKQAGEPDNHPYILIHKALHSLLSNFPESYKIWPWAVKMIKKNNGPTDAHFVDIVGQAGKLLHELRQNNRIPEGFDINQVATFPDLEDWLYNYRGQNAASEWEDADHYVIFPDGWTVDKVTTESDLNREGSIMGHCVGGYFDEVKEGGSIIYSLRDPHGGSHATIELGKRGQIISGGDSTESKESQAIRQVQGKSNKPPVDEYIERVKKFFHQYMHNENLQLVDTGWAYNSGGEFVVSDGASLEEFWEIWKDNPKALEEPSLKVTHKESEWGGGILDGEEIEPIEIYIRSWKDLIGKVMDDFYPHEYQQERRDYGESRGHLDWREATQALYTLAWLEKEDPSKVLETIYDLMNGIEEIDNQYNYEFDGWDVDAFDNWNIPMDDDGNPDLESKGYEDFREERYKDMFGNARHIPTYLAGLPYAHGGYKEINPGSPSQPSARGWSLKHPHDWREEQIPGFDYRNEPQIPRPHEFVKPDDAKRLWDDYIDRMRVGWNKDMSDPHYGSYRSAKFPIIPAPIPFVFDIEKDQIHTGQPGHKHKDIKPSDKLTVNVVEGLYLPDGKLQFRSESTMPYSVRYLIRLWYTLFPELEVKQVHKLVGDKKYKLAKDR